MQRETDRNSFAQPKGDRVQDYLTDVYNLKGDWREDGARVSLEGHNERQQAQAKTNNQICNTHGIL